MRAYLGNGWTMRHLTDRTIGLVKPSVAYRRVTNRDGWVFVRGEPGIAREVLIEKALRAAQREDAKLAEILGKQLAPDRRAFDGTLQRITPAFETPEDPARIGRKAV
jgi:hypothetical protein